MLALVGRLKAFFFEDFWHLEYPENHILAPRGKSQPPPTENSWCHPWYRYSVDSMAIWYNFRIGTVKMQLIRDTFCYGIEAAPVQCELGLKRVANKERLSPMTVKDL